MKVLHRKNPCRKNYKRILHRNLNRKDSNEFCTGKLMKKMMAKFYTEKIFMRQVFHKENPGRKELLWDLSAQEKLLKKIMAESCAEKSLSDKFRAGKILSEKNRRRHLHWKIPEKNDDRIRCRKIPIRQILHRKYPCGRKS